MQQYNVKLELTKKKLFNKLFVIFYKFEMLNILHTSNNLFNLR